MGVGWAIDLVVCSVSFGWVTLLLKEKKTKIY